MNGQNINLFPFDYDLTWMAFFMDAHDRCYARYGGREDAGPESYLTKASLLKVMRDVLRLHKEGAVLTGRHEPSDRPQRTPEDIPGLSARIAKRKANNRCIHCHDVKMAELEARRQAGTFRKEMIFTYPLPSAVGLFVEPDEQTKVRAVKPQSPAAAAGARAGDVLQALDGARVLTVADFSHVLEHTTGEAQLPLEVRRAGQAVRMNLHLTGDWRRTADPSWRSSTYLAGPNAGLWAVPLTDAEKRTARIPVDNLALRITFFFPGQETPKQAGLQLGDVIVEVDGSRRPLTTRQLHTHCQMDHTYGDKLPLVVRRGEQELKLTLELPRKPAQLN
jgi:predicted metalloprotease with PDZ domain